MEKWLDKLWENSGELASLGLTILIVLIAGRLVIRLGSSLAEKALTLKLSRHHTPEEAKRMATLVALSQNVIRYATLFIMIVTILDRFGVPVMAILSAAGVLGVGIAFGEHAI